MTKRLESKTIKFPTDHKGLESHDGGCYDEFEDWEVVCELLEKKVFIKVKDITYCFQKPLDRYLRTSILQVLFSIQKNQSHKLHD